MNKLCYLYVVITAFIIAQFCSGSYHNTELISQNYPAYVEYVCVRMQRRACYCQVLRPSKTRLYTKHQVLYTSFWPEMRLIWRHLHLQCLQVLQWIIRKLHRPFIGVRALQHLT